MIVSPCCVVYHFETSQERRGWGTVVVSRHNACPKQNINKMFILFVISRIPSMGRKIHTPRRVSFVSRSVSSPHDDNLLPCFVVRLLHPVLGKQNERI